MMIDGSDETDLRDIRFQDAGTHQNMSSGAYNNGGEWQSGIDFLDLGTSYRPSFEDFVSQCVPIEWSDLNLASCSDSGDELFVSANCVLLCRNGALKRKFTFDAAKQVLQATFCRFYSGERSLTRGEVASVGDGYRNTDHPRQSAKQNSYGPLRTAATEYLEEHSSLGSSGPAYIHSIVIFLEDEAYCYTEDGTSYIINLPFRLEQAWPLTRGLLLERKITKLSPSDSYYSSEQEQFLANLSIRSADDIPDRELPKFFTLLDPLLEFGLVASRTADKIDPDETLVLVPASLDSFLTATFSAETCMLSVYAINYSQSGKGATMNRKRSTMTRRKSSFVQQGGKEDENIERRVSARTDMSLTIQRESTSQFPGAADGTAQSLFLQNSHNLDKDIFVKRIESFPLEGYHKSLPSVYSTTNHNQECLIIEDSARAKLILLYFERARSGRSPSFRLVHSISIPAKSVSPITFSESSNGSFHLLVLSVDGSSHMFDPWTNEASLKFSLHLNIDRLSPFNGQLIRYKEKGTKATGLLRMQLFPDSTFLKKCLYAILAVLPPKEASRFTYQWSMSLRNLRARDEWTAFRIAFVSSWIGNELWNEDLCNSITLENPSNGLIANDIWNIVLQSNSLDGGEEVYSIVDVLSLAYMLKKECGQQISDFSGKRSASIIALQLLHEEMLLDICNTKDSKRLRYFIQQLAWWAGWSPYWKFLCDGEAPVIIDKNPRFGCDLPRDAQLYPSLYNSLHSAILSQSVPKFMSLKKLNMAEVDDSSLFPMTNKILDIYGKLYNPNIKASNIVESMAVQGFTEKIIRRLPIGIAYPLLEVIAYCRLYTPTKWGSKELNLVDRSDLKYLANPETAPISNQRFSRNKEARDVRTVVASIYESERMNIFDSSSEQAHIALSKLIFCDDRRLQEASKLLQTTRQHVVTHNELSSLSEQEIIQERMKLCFACMERTEAASVGRCPFFYATRKLLITEHFNVPNLNFSLLIRPAMVTTSPDKGDLPNASTSWPLFHTGVGAGLSICANSPEITGSWITFNRPAELSAKHAGFLLGLGLNNNLKRLEEWHIYNYLGPKHTPTSIGLLLGMCASYLGSMDPKVTKVLSVHITALLPPGSRDLNVTLAVQTSGLVGLGLLYCGTQNRRMTEVLIGEMEGTGFHRSFQPNEGYMLAAGFGLGLINLGKGHDLRGFQGLGLVQRLLQMAIHTRNAPSSVKNTRDSAAGAIVALTFMFIKSEDKRLAEKIGIPSAEALMDYVRPDILLLRTVAQHVICWSRIKNDQDWILSSVPNFFRLKAQQLSSVTSLDSDDLPIYNILVGLAFSMALKFSSTGDESSRETLLYYIDEFTRLTLLQCTTHDQRITRSSLFNGLGLLLLSVSTVMVGTGDVDVLRRLRRIHGHLSNPYGLQMACHLSLGILFLGGGQCGFKSSNLALASLMIAFYPQFPSKRDEIRFHLQAFRHLWVLAAEHRCLVTRELNSQKACVVPVQIKLKSGKIVEASTPCLLPEYDALERITIESPDFWPVTLDFLVNPEHLRRLKTNQTIYLYRQDIKTSNDYSFAKLLGSEDRSEEIGQSSRAELFRLGQSLKLSLDEERIFFQPETSLHDDFSSKVDMVDSKIALEQMSTSPQNEEDLWNIRLILDSADSRNETLRYLDEEFIERMRLRIWQSANMQND